MRLILLRHAKSANNSGTAHDHDRPLNNRGRQDAPRIGQRLVESGWIPDHVLSSDAVRTQQTWEMMQPVFPQPISVTWSRSLYHRGAEVLNQLVGRPESTLMLIGHNPGWEAVVETLSGQAHRLTTCNAALLCIEADDWASGCSKIGQWTLVDILRPRTL